MESRVKELRKQRDIPQAMLGKHLGTSQQTISKIERDIYSAQVDLLVGIAKYFNVTTDYLLGLTDVRRSAEKQPAADQTTDEYCFLIEEYKCLDRRDRKLIRGMISMMYKNTIECRD